MRVGSKLDSIWGSGASVTSNFQDCFGTYFYIIRVHESDYTSEVDGKAVRGFLRSGRLAMLDSAVVDVGTSGMASDFIRLGRKYTDSTSLDIYNACILLTIISIVEYLHTHLSPSSSLEHAEYTGPCLPDSRLNLVRGQRETVRALVTELVSVGICCATGDICVVGRRTGGSVQSRAAGADGVSSAGDSADGGCGVGGQSTVRCVVFGTG